MKKRFVSLVSWVILFLFCFQSTALAAEDITFYHTDNAGTPLAMSDMAGKRVWRADYKPFGEEFSVEGGVGERKRFVGKEKDEETGLNYFGARFLSTGNGRFLAPDPIRAVDPYSGKANPLILENPQRVNAYAYALNNPYRHVDPDGQIPVDTIWDIGNIIYDIYTGDKVALAADLPALALPYVPAGTSKLLKGASKATDAVITPGGRTLTNHAYEQATKGAPGRRPMSLEEIDKVLDEGNVIKKVDMNHPGGPTVTVQNTNMPGMPRVIVDADSGKRVITVIQPNSNKTK